MLPAGKQAFSCPKLAKGFWIPLWNASLTFSFYTIDLGCDVLELPAFPWQRNPTALPFLPGVPGSPQEKLWSYDSSISCLPIHPSEQCQVGVERLDVQPSFATSFLYVIKTLHSHLCIQSSQSHICIPKRCIFPSLAHLTYLPAPVCKPFATAFSFVDSQELSFAPLSFPPRLLLHPFAVPDPGVMISITVALPGFWFVLFSVLGIKPRYQVSWTRATLLSYIPSTSLESLGTIEPHPHPFLWDSRQEFSHRDTPPAFYCGTLGRCSTAESHPWPPTGGF